MFQHIIRCQNNFLSDCDFTIVFKDNRGKTACIVILLKRDNYVEGCHTDICIQLKLI